MQNRADLGKYNLPRDRQERFWSFVQKTKGGCWIWTGSFNSSKRNQGGYGKFRANGHHIRSHVYAWVIFNGVPPEGMVVAHECDNRKCVNPAHLALKTQKQNVADMHSRKRAHKLFHFSERQLCLLAERLNISQEEMMTAIEWLSLQPTLRFPNGKPRNPH